MNWRQPPEENAGESYFHPFGAPLKVGAVDPLRAWSKLPKEKRGNIADVFSVQSEMAEMGRAPKHLKDRPYDGALSYAYHLDAGKFAEYLKQRFRAQGIKHIIGKVTEVDYDPVSENISALILDDGAKLTSDLYIDCTGFAARLINSDKQNSFIDKTDVLFVDKAVTNRLPTKGAASINGYTTCTAQSAGWIWDIVLQNRRGVGHVYSSKYIDDAQAKSELASYLMIDEDELETRKLEYAYRLPPKTMARQLRRYRTLERIFGAIGVYRHLPHRNGQLGACGFTAAVHDRRQSPNPIHRRDEPSL